MKITQLIPAAFMASALLTTGALAQNPGSAPSANAPQPNEFVYVQKLPTPADLVNGAKAQGVTVSKVDQMNGQVIAVYNYPNGATATVAFQLLPAGEAAAPGQPAPAYQGQPANSVAVPSTSAPVVAGSTTVVYDSAPGYAYYPAGAYYEPYYGYGYGWYPPVSIGLGFGWGYHGGYRGGWGGGFRGGFRR